MLGMVCFTAAMQIQQVGQGWLVYHLTGSSTTLSIVNSLWSVSLLVFSPIGGVIADRTDRRRILVITWGITALMYAVVTALLFMDRLEIWHLGAASLATGMLFALNIPARNALISQLTPETQFASAMALTSVVFNINMVISPLIGGALIDTIGVVGAYALVAVFYVGAVIGMSRVPVQPLVKRTVRTSVFQDMIAGANVVRHHAGLRWLLLLGLVAVIVSQPFQGLLPQIAKQTLNVPASGLGLLMAMTGVGAFCGNLVIANQRHGADLTKWLLILALVTGVALIGLALSTTLWLALVMLFLIGISAMPFGTLNQTLVQRLAPPEIRGRVLSIYMLTWGAMPIGQMASSILSDSMGPAVPLAICGVTMIGVAVVATLLRPAEAKNTAVKNVAGSPLPAGK